MSIIMLQHIYIPGTEIYRERGGGGGGGGEEVPLSVPQHDIVMFLYDFVFNIVHHFWYLY